MNPLFLVTFFPLVGFLIILILKDTQKDAIRWVAFGTALINFVLSIVLLLPGFDPNATNYEINLPWANIGGSIVSFHMGLDGLSILLVLLTTFLIPIAILSAFSVQDRVKGFMLFFLLLEVGMTGVFLAMDLVLFFVFWEFSLIPMYFLIGIWGGTRKVYAAIKFVLFTMLGSMMMLLAIIYLGTVNGSFSLADLMTSPKPDLNTQILLFLAFGLAFAIKVPIWPLHTWLPDAHVEAPTAGSVILAAVMLKMGAYGFLRFNIPLFPDATRVLAPWLAVLAVIGIVYGAAVAYVQKDIKKLVAYSSVSHLGFVVLGLFALTTQGVSGGILQMVNHGLSTGALFLIVGMLYERRHTRDINAFGGIWKVMPVFGALALIVSLSSIGLPGLNGFVGEFTILLGAFGSPALNSPWFAGIATTGVILAAVYLLFWFEKVFLGRVTNEENAHLPALNWREMATLLPLLAVIFWIGLYPQPFFNLIVPSVEKLLTVVP